MRGWRNFRIYLEPKHVSGELWTDKRPALRALLERTAHRSSFVSVSGFSSTLPSHTKSGSSPLAHSA